MTFRLQQLIGCKSQLTHLGRIYVGGTRRVAAYFAGVSTPQAILAPALPYGSVM